MTQSESQIRSAIVIEVTGQPVAQGRPRAAAIGGRVRVYKPAKSRTWENDARQLARIKMEGQKPLEGCLSLDLTVMLLPPLGWPKWKREAALGWLIEPTGRPDLDNYLKSAKDALNGVVWLDDSQVTKVIAKKIYSEQPMMRILVETRGRASSKITRKDQLGGTG